MKTQIVSRFRAWPSRFLLLGWSAFAAALPLSAQTEMLQITQAPNEVVIRWLAPNALLQGTDALDGEWREVTGARSPHRIPTKQAQRFYRLVITGPVPGPRSSDPEPLPEVVQAVRQFQETDPDASFNYFNGHVDSFATSAKPTLPAYALDVLKSLGLPTVNRKPMKLRDPASAEVTPKPARDLDEDFDRALPILPETELGQPIVTDGNPDFEDKPIDPLPKEETRSKPPINPQSLIAWERPSPEIFRLERQAATPILVNFLDLHPEVFEVSANEFPGVMELQEYRVGAFFRKATYTQSYAGEEKILYGRTLVHFDVNWNVMGISRMIITPRKLAVAQVPDPVSQERAIEAALKSVPTPDCAGQQAQVLRAERCVDPVRRMRVWDVEMSSTDGNCHWRTIVDAAQGEVLNVTDLMDRAYTDAKVNRWYFSGGDQFNPQQIVSTGIYTRNDRRLEHDFFYVMNDHRCEGNPEANCSATSHADTWCDDAHGSYNGASYIRATRRTNRDFDNYYPSGSSETFAETHAYYWARSFSQWLKPSLDALGVLPGSAANYPRVLIITDACRDGSVHNSSYSVTTDSNKGEGGSVIRLGHRDPTDSSNHNYGCEGGGCYDNPSNLAHELNHFYLKKYYGVGSDLDCGAANQLKFTHEGILGTAVPQAYWHYYYGVGYKPSTSKLYFSHTDIGRVHSSESTRMTVGNYLCVNYTGDPYSAGRVAGQALWEFYHGKRVVGSTQHSTWYPSTDTDFNVLAYWAADLQAASTYKDRYEFANRLMEILDKHSNWSSSAKQQYCEIFEHHSLHWYINSAYCN